MAISDISIYNTYIARSLQKPDVESLSANTIPADVRDNVNDRIREAVANNEGINPNSLYGEVAGMLSPYVPSMNRTALASLLRVNNLFGLGEGGNTGFNLGDTISEFRKRFEDKSSEISVRTVNTFGEGGTDGTLGDISNVQGGLSTGEKPELVESTVDLPRPPPYEVGTEEVTATGKFVSSVEELEYDMGSATRDISEIVVHTSETFTNANLTGKQLTELTGSGTESYHYIIKRDGSIERGVPIKSAGDHCPGHNSYSIGVCLVGGVSAASGDTGLEERKDASDITRSQYNSLYEIFRVFYTQYPGGQALGHSEVDNTEDDPGFEVRDYVYSTFNKVSLYIDTENKTQLSPDDINAAVDGDGSIITDKDTTILDQKF